MTRLAKGISLIFNPLILAPILLLVIGYLSGEDIGSIFFWPSLMIVVVIVPLISLILIRYMGNEYSDLDVSIRAQRHEAYSCAIICFLVLLFLLHWFDAPRSILIPLYAAGLAIGLSYFVNKYVTKISLHSLGMAGACFTTVPFSVIVGGVFVFFTLAVGWSRIHLNRHTWSQVVLGWGMAWVCVTIISQII